LTLLVVRGHAPEVHRRLEVREAGGEPHADVELRQYRVRHCDARQDHRRFLLDDVVAPRRRRFVEVGVELVVVAGLPGWTRRDVAERVRVRRVETGGDVELGDRPAEIADHRDQRHGLHRAEAERRLRVVLLQSVRLPRVRHALLHDRIVGAVALERHRVVDRGDAERDHSALALADVCRLSESPSPSSADATAAPARGRDR
jgi:hypothetical protein